MSKWSVKFGDLVSVCLSLRVDLDGEGESSLEGSMERKVTYLFRRYSRKGLHQQKILSHQASIMQRYDKFSVQSPLVGP